MAAMTAAINFLLSMLTPLSSFLSHDLSRCKCICEIILISLDCVERGPCESDLFLLDEASMPKGVNGFYREMVFGLLW